MGVNNDKSMPGKEAPSHVTAHQFDLLSFVQ